MLAFLDRMIDSLAQRLSEFIAEGLIRPLAEGALQTTLRALSYLADAPLVLDWYWVRNLILLGQGVGGALLAFRVGERALRAYVLQDAPGLPTPMLRNAAYAAAMVGGSPWLVAWVFDFSGRLLRDFARVGTLVEYSDAGLFTNVFNLVGGAFMTVFLLLAFAILAFFLPIQAGIRGVEAVFLAAAGPVLAVGLVDDSEGAWGVWWRELLVVALSQVVQMLAIAVTFNALINPPASLRQALFLQPYVALGGAWVAIRSPAMVRQYAYSTGVGGFVGDIGKGVLFRVLLRR